MRQPPAPERSEYSFDGGSQAPASPQQTAADREREALLKRLAGKVSEYMVLVMSSTMDYSQADILSMALQSVLQTELEAAATSSAVAVTADELKAYWEESQRDTVPRRPRTQGRKARLEVRRPGDSPRCRDEEPEEPLPAKRQHKRPCKDKLNLSLRVA